MSSKTIYTTSFQTEVILDRIRTELKKPVDRKAFSVLMRKLEQAQSRCDNDSLHAEIISLYGRVVEEFHHYVQCTIHDIALLLLDPNNDAAALKKQLLRFRTMDGISREIAESIAALDPLTACRSKTVLAMPEDIEQLWTLASHIFYEQSPQMIENTLSCLSMQRRKMLLEHMPLAFLTSSHMNKMTALQFLFSFIYKLLGRPISATWKPSHQEIRSFFKEKEKVCRKDVMHSVIPFALPA